jgi:hypothetical protein
MIRSPWLGSNRAGRRDPPTRIPVTDGPGCDLGGRSTLIRASRSHRYEAARL